MEFAAHICYQEDYSGRRVFLMRIIRYIQTGYLLHLMGTLSIMLTYFFGNKFLILLFNKGSSGSLILNGCASLYFFTLIFFSMLDARSRYQNYKMAKDRLFKYGFDKRLLKPFVFSRCQRDAIRTAARDLNYGREWEQLRLELGFRWYHILPHLLVRHPGMLFTKKYWSKTLFVSTYHSKYFLW